MTRACPSPLALRLLCPALPLAAALLVAIACSSTPAPSTAPPKNGGSSSGAAPAPSGSDPARCGNAATAGDCADCCGETDSTFRASDDVFDDCVCAGPCKTPCASTFCAHRETEPAGECAKCYDSAAASDGCEDPADKACSDDPACKVVSDCEVSSHCDDKPDPDADGG